MSERALRNTLVIGTVLLFIVLLALTINSLNQVVSARTQQVTDQVVAGKKLWQSRNCNDCHTILGIGGYFAPELTKEASRRDATWLQSWLANPQAVKPGTTMPKQGLTDAEVLDLVAFLQWVNTIDTNNWPPQPQMALGGSTVPSGPVLFQQKGCVACHTINGQGGKDGPDLSHIGSQPYDGLANDPAFLTQWLKGPSAIKPGTMMPTIPMTDAERSALVDYLTSLK